MEHVLLERKFDPAISVDDFMEMAREGVDCMPLYRVVWRESLMSADGNHLLCRFEAPDTEAVRMVARDTHPKAKIAWAGTVHDTGREGDATVVVERSFEAAVTLEELQAREDAAAWCMEQHQVTFLRTFFSLDRKRMICLYSAPDAESVRVAQKQAKMPVERVWACRRFSMADFAG
jgi:Nickel responsive protein SCO4226-like